MCRVIPYHGLPSIAEQAFKLHDKTHNLTLLDIKRNAQGICLIKQTTKLNGSHEEQL